MNRHIITVIFLFFNLNVAQAKDILRIFTWEGYVTNEDIDTVNRLFSEGGYDIEAKVIQPYASSDAQMFDVIRSGQCDVTFLTLNYIKGRPGYISDLLQSVDPTSPRLSNYSRLRRELTGISMGMNNGRIMYIPFGGGAYGIWANMKKLKKGDLPKSVKELWDPKWKGKLSLSSEQTEPNIAIVMLALDKPPFYLNELMNEGKRNEAIRFANDQAQERSNLLYGQVAHFWGTVPKYDDDLLLTASYGFEIAEQNAKGSQWEFVSFKEGSTVWMDTINFTKEITGKKLEAAEIFANYMIGKKVQDRIVRTMNMASVSTLVKKNPLIDADPNFFSEKMFWPPYNSIARNLMKLMSNTALVSGIVIK